MNRAHEIRSRCYVETNRFECDRMKLPQGYMLRWEFSPVWIGGSVSRQISVWISYPDGGMCVLYHPQFNRGASVVVAPSLVTTASKVRRVQGHIQVLSDTKMGGILSDLIPEKYLIRVSDTRTPRYLNLIRYSDTKKKGIRVFQVISECEANKFRHRPPTGMCTLCCALLLV